MSDFEILRMNFELAFRSTAPPYFFHFNTKFSKYRLFFFPIYEGETPLQILTSTDVGDQAQKSALNVSHLVRPDARRYEDFVRMAADRRSHQL